jgi:hypothetical protein
MIPTPSVCELSHTELCLPRVNNLRRRIEEDCQVREWIMLAYPLPYAMEVMYGPIFVADQNVINVTIR